MDYRTILVHVDPSTHCAARVRLAAALALACDARLVGLAPTNLSRDVCPEGYSWTPGKLIAGYLDPLFDAANRSLDAFETVARAAGVAHPERRIVCDQADEGLARAAAAGDLLVLSQNDPAESTSDVIANLPEYPILASGRPVLLAPNGAEHALPAQQVLLAWNGSREAVAALAGALPLLRRAARVLVVRLDADDAARADEPALAAYLQGHGVQARFLDAPAGADAGATLLALAAQHDCGLLVMGCYGQARLRELLLGGATRTVLARMNLPVLMAH